MNNNIIRFPKCNSGSVRKRSMIVKTGVYDRAGISTSLFNNSPLRVSFSRGQNNWIDELQPMSYLLPVLMTLVLVMIFNSASFSLISGFAFFIAMIINVFWFISVDSDKNNYEKQWACSKCGEVWTPKNLMNWI